jgi:hypothetical protein
MKKPDFGPPPSADLQLRPSPDEVKFFKDNGFLVVDRITTDEEIAWLKAIFQHIFDEQAAGEPGAPVDRSGTWKKGEKRSMLQQAFFPEIQYPEILNTVFRRNAKRYAAALLDVDEDRLSSWGHMIQKPPGGRAALWHQDHAYWQPEFDYHALGVWLPMHDVSVEMGAMQFIPGSHKWGLLPHRQADDPKHNVLTVLDKIDTTKAVACPLKAGGATIHHSETLHYTAPNSTNQPRLAFPMEFQLAPVRRKVPVVMPWVDDHRATQSEPRKHMYVADGEMIPL